MECNFMHSWSRLQEELSIQPHTSIALLQEKQPPLLLDEILGGPQIQPPWKCEKKINCRESNPVVKPIAPVASVARSVGGWGEVNIKSYVLTLAACSLVL